MTTNMTVALARDLVDDAPGMRHCVPWSGDAEDLRRLLGDAFGFAVDGSNGDENDVAFQGSRYRLGKMRGGYVDIERDTTLTGRIVDGSYMIMVPVFGPVEVAVAGQSVAVQPGYALMSNPGETLHLDVVGRRRLWFARVPLSAVHAALVASGDGTRARPLRFDRLMDLRQGAGRSWARMAVLVRQELESEGALVEVPEVARAYEQALVETLLRVQRHTYSDQFQHQSAHSNGDGPGPGHEPWPQGLREAVRLIDEYPTRRHRVDDLARHARVSTKTLQKYFRHYLGVTPVEYLRVRRLDLAHQALLAADRSTTNVEAITRRLGFKSYGHFSRHYQERFGQLPGDTLRLASG